MREPPLRVMKSSSRYVRVPDILTNILTCSIQALNVGMLLRKAATVSTPVMEVTEEEGTWNIKTSTILKTMELKFKVRLWDCGN